MNADRIVVCTIVGISACTWAVSRAGDMTIETLVLEGDSVDGVGLITSINNIAVNNDGHWLVEADTDHPDTDADSVLLQNGVLYMREGDPVSAPDGATLDSFDSVTLNDLGDAGFNFFLDGTDDIFDDSGVYWNTVLVYQESEEAPGLTPGTPFIGFFDVKINNANQLLLTASVDDPNIETSVDRALYVLDIDDSGAPVDFTLIAVEGDVLPGQTESVTDFGTSPHESAFNDNGDVLFTADLTGDSSMNAAIYLNDTLLGQEGFASPVEGRDWSSLTSVELDVNNSGDYVFSGSLQGDSSSNLLLVKNGETFRQEGDTLDAIGGASVFTSFGSGPLEISDPGDVLWYGDWDNPNTDIDTGLFLNDELLIQEGITEIAFLFVDTLRGVEDGYHMSNNGQYIIFEAVLEDGSEGAFLITLPAAVCEGDANGEGQVTICHISPGNPDNAHTISVGVNAIPAHLAHGDTCGPCDGDSAPAAPTSPSIATEQPNRMLFAPSEATSSASSINSTSSQGNK